jgi:galactokinase
VTAVTARAPGRVNLIGEHTDYNGGYVLPVPIPCEATVTLERAEGDRVRVVSAAYPGEDVLEYDLGAERRRDHWSDYVAGATHVLLHDGHRLGGFSARIDSAVPVGAGLSSSAALGVALLRALREAFGLGLDDLAIARLAQRIETDFVGAPVGVMDPMAASLGEPGVALFIDTRTLDHRAVAIPGDAQLAVVDSGVPHRHAEGGYRRRRAECAQAAARLGVRELRDVTPSDLVRAALPAPLDRRARHVVTENARVLAMVQALAAADLAGAGALLNQSHVSLQRDFEVSVPEIDALVEAAWRAPAVQGARLTGGGFGGAVVILLRRDAGGSPQAIVEAVRRAGGRPRVVIPDIHHPARRRASPAATRLSRS